MIRAADLCFICYEPLADGREIVTVGLGFDVHKECNDNDDEEL